MDNPIVGFMKTNESILKTHGESIGHLVDMTISNHKEIEKMKKVLEALIKDAKAYKKEMGDG